MRHLILRHISGSKANQVDEFPVDQVNILTLGRDIDQTVRYDPDSDDLVSKQHAQIFGEKGHDDKFFITDLNSRNGTYVNKQRIYDTAGLVPGDIVQLGPGGPEFQFDLEPSPGDMLRPTREASHVHETREATPSPALSSASTKPAVGRATVERMLSIYQESSRRTFITLAAALVGVVILVAGGLIYLNLRTTKTMGGKIEEITEKMVNVKPAATSADPTMPPAEIARKFGRATVFIEVSWKLMETKTNRQVYHQRMKKRPAYIRINEDILPWLSLDDEHSTNRPIGGDKDQGSGFAVTDTGFILSARHVVAPWNTAYTVSNEGEPVVYNVDPETGQVLLDRELMSPDTWQSPQYHSYGRVLLSDMALLVEKQKNGSYKVVPGNRFEGRYEFLNVTFPNDKLHMPARLVRTSDQYDVALIKVEAPYPVPKVDLHDTYSNSRPGDKIVVLGYPAVSPDATVRTKSYDPLNPAFRSQKVRDLTVTDGLIGKIIRGNVKLKDGDSYEYYSGIGDVFQLTINATGAGNSGGPVFDDRGGVIGIFAYKSKDRDVLITFAVPIRFGMEIMRIKTIFN